MHRRRVATSMNSTCHRRQRSSQNVTTISESLDSPSGRSLRQISRTSTNRCHHSAHGPRNPPSGYMVDFVVIPMDAATYHRQGRRASTSLYQEYNCPRSTADFFRHQRNLHRLRRHIQSEMRDDRIRRQELPPQYKEEEPPPSYDEAVMKTCIAQQISSSDQNNNNREIIVNPVSISIPHDLNEDTRL